MRLKFVLNAPIQLKVWRLLAVAFVLRQGFPSVLCRCRKGVFPGGWLADSSVVFRSDVLGVG